MNLRPGKGRGCPQGNLGWGRVQKMENNTCKSLLPPSKRLRVLKVAKPREERLLAEGSRDGGRGDGQTNGQTGGW